LDQFSFSSSKISGFRSFNQILLSLFDISYIFDDCILFLSCLHRLTHFYFNIKSTTSMKRVRNIK